MVDFRVLVLPPTLSRPNHYSKLCHGPEGLEVPGVVGEHGAEVHQGVGVHVRLDPVGHLGQGAAGLNSAVL